MKNLAGKVVALSGQPAIHMIRIAGVYALIDVELSDRHRAPIKLCGAVHG